jgi:hypothetical protein
MRYHPVTEIVTVVSKIRPRRGRCVTFSNMLVLRRETLTYPQTPRFGITLVGCLWLHTECTRIYPPYLKTFPNGHSQRTRRAVVTRCMISVPAVISLSESDKFRKHLLKKRGMNGITVRSVLHFHLSCSGKVTAQTLLCSIEATWLFHQRSWETPINFDQETLKEWLLRRLSTECRVVLLRCSLRNVAWGRGVTTSGSEYSTVASSCDVANRRNNKRRAIF